MPAGEVESVFGYTGVVLGGSMILGWHRKARKFYKKHNRELSQIPVHVFMTPITTWRRLGKLPRWSS